MDPIAIAAVIGLVAVAKMKVKPPAGDGNVDGVPPVTDGPVIDPGPGGSTEQEGTDGVPQHTSNDGAGPVTEPGTGGSGKHPTTPGGSCACVKAPCACQGGDKPTNTMPTKPAPTGSSPDTSPSTKPQPGGYDGSGIIPRIPYPGTVLNKPTSKPGSTGGQPTKPTKPTTGGKQTDLPQRKTSILTSMDKTTKKDINRALEANGPAAGAIW